MRKKIIKTIASKVYEWPNERWNRLIIRGRKYVPTGELHLLRQTEYPRKSKTRKAQLTRMISNLSTSSVDPTKRPRLTHKAIRKNRLEKLYKKEFSFN